MLSCAKEAGDSSLVNLDQVFTGLIHALGEADYYNEIALLLEGILGAIEIISTSLPYYLSQKLVKNTIGIVQDLSDQRENRVVQQEWMDDVQKEEEELVEHEEDAALRSIEKVLQGILSSTTKLPEQDRGDEHRAGSPIHQERPANPAL